MVKIRGIQVVECSEHNVKNLMIRTDLSGEECIETTRGVEEQKARSSNMDGEKSRRLKSPSGDLGVKKGKSINVVTQLVSDLVRSLSVDRGVINVSKRPIGVKPGSGEELKAGRVKG